MPIRREFLWNVRPSNNFQDNQIWSNKNEIIKLIPGEYEEPES